MQPLSDLRAKPALPVLGLPVIVTLLEFLKKYGVREVLINVHHRAESIRQAVRDYGPKEVSVTWSEEEKLLGTGGGIRRAADFLRQSETSVVLGGDALLDLDLGAAIQRHRQRRSGHTTLLLRRDGRSQRFGSIGIDSAGEVARIGRRYRRSGEADSGVFLSARLFSAHAFNDLPDRAAFEDLSDWLIPRLERGSGGIYGDLLEADRCVWEPAGTPAEYLKVNLRPPALSYLEAGTMLRRTGTVVDGSRIIGRGARLGEGCRLERCVIWEEERVPPNQTGDHGVFASGRFHPCPDRIDDETVES